MLNPRDRLQIEVNFNRDISPQPMSQMDAALEAVRRIGLNQKEKIKKEWFSDPVQWEMFQRRYQMLVSAAQYTRGEVQLDRDECSYSGK